LKLAARLAYREAGPPDGPVALLLHGFPESSYLWRHLLPALADAGWRAIAPDFAGFGESDPDLPGTWERHVESLERFRNELGIERCVPVVHDWGGLIGLRWACEHPEAVRALVISSTGFFADGRWHGMAEAMRAPGTGEQLLESIDRDGFAGLLRGLSPAFDDAAIEQYWTSLADPVRRRGVLDLYRSGDFEKLAGYRLADLDVPALIVWGASDEFAPVGGAHRFERELSRTELVVLEDAGHFVWEEAPERSAEAVTGFLARIETWSGSST